MLNTGAQKSGPQRNCPVQKRGKRYSNTFTLRFVYFNDYESQEKAWIDMYMYNCYVIFFVKNGIIILAKSLVEKYNKYYY